MAYKKIIFLFYFVKFVINFIYIIYINEYQLNTIYFVKE